MNCILLNIKLCAVCNSGVKRFHETCWVEWYSKRIKHYANSNVKDYLMICLKEDTIEPTHGDYYYLNAAVKHYYSEQWDDFNKLMVLL